MPSADIRTAFLMLFLTSKNERFHIISGSAISSQWKTISFIVFETKSGQHSWIEEKTTKMSSEGIIDLVTTSVNTWGYLYNNAKQSAYIQNARSCQTVRIIWHLKAPWYFHRRVKTSRQQIPQVWSHNIMSNVTGTEYLTILNSTAPEKNNIS